MVVAHSDARMRAGSGHVRRERRPEGPDGDRAAAGRRRGARRRLLPVAQRQRVGVDVGESPTNHMARFATDEGTIFYSKINFLYSISRSLLL